MTVSDFAVPINDRYFEDYLPGTVFEYPTAVSVDEAAIIEFSRKFDPMSFHIDPKAASQGPYGGLIASGWHTAALMNRLLCSVYLSSVACLGSPGADEVRLPRPVRPGDSLRIRVSTLEARRSTSKPDRGTVRMLVEVLNQQSEIVMSAKLMVLMRCRHSDQLSHAAADHPSSVPMKPDTAPDRI